jgi:oligoendopeptidase F
VVDISSSILFEKTVIEQRAKRELSVAEFKETMLAAQRATYGDGVDPATYHQFMWAAKPHYYDVNEGFYNFPYMFGLLFGLGLYARYVEDPETFKAGYDELLSMTGMADAATLAARFGIDLRGRAFWDASLKVVEQDVDRFMELTSAGTSS